jgi:hypothetical protein
MKIINETPTEMSLAHPSARRGVVGGAFAFVGGVLFLASAVDLPALSYLSYTSFACFGLGLAILFTNAADTIDIDKIGGTVRFRTTRFVGARSGTYPLGQAKRIELHQSLMSTELSSIESRLSASARPTKCEAFLVFADGTRLHIDYEHLRNDPSESIAERVSRFLNLPIADTEPSSPDAHRLT